MIVTEEQKKEIKKYGVDIDKLIKNGDVNEVLFAIDDVILDLMDEDGELDKEGVKLQLIYDQIYNLDSRINMTRLVPQLRVLHKSQPA